MSEQLDGLRICQKRRVIYGERPVYKDQNTDPRPDPTDTRNQLDPTTTNLNDKTLAARVLPKQAAPAIRTACPVHHSQPRKASHGLTGSRTGGAVSMRRGDWVGHALDKIRRSR